jgi:hypothetical protein
MPTQTWDEVTQCLMCNVSPVVAAAALASASDGWLDVAGREMSARWSPRREGRERPSRQRENGIVVDFAAAPGRPACRLTAQVNVASMAGGGSLVWLRGRLVPRRLDTASVKYSPTARFVRSSAPWSRRGPRRMGDVAVVPGQAAPMPRVAASAPPLWWAPPLVTVVVLGGFTVYGVWTALVGGLSTWGPDLSPFWSPRVPGAGPVPAAVWILPIPLAFRATSYYRKANYRSSFWDPPACTVGELRHRGYRGETRFPLILNNLHRFAMYLATIVLLFLWADVVVSLRYAGAWYLGIGTAVMALNVVLLTGYTASCHSLRHLVGGGVNCFSAVALGGLRHRLWRGVSRLNQQHPSYAWLSLASVVATDVYIRLLQHGVLTDPHVVF